MEFFSDKTPRRLSDPLWPSRTLIVQSDLPVHRILDYITSGPLESISSVNGRTRVSFLERSAAAKCLANLEGAKAPFTARLARYSFPLSAGIISAIHLRGVTRSLRVFARTRYPRRAQHSMSRTSRVFGSMEKTPDLSRLSIRNPYITCHYLDIRYAIKVYSK